MTLYLLDAGGAGLYFIVIGLFIFFIVLAILVVLSFLLVNSPLMWIYFELLQVGFEFDSETLNLLIYAYSIVASVFSFCLLLPVIFLGMLFMYHTAEEVLSASSLKHRIQSMGENIKKK